MAALSGTMTIRLDDGLSRFHDALSQFQSAVEALDCPVEIRLGLLNFASHLISQGKAVKFNCVLTPGTNELTVVAHPSQRLLGLMAAVGAGE